MRQRRYKDSLGTEILIHLNRVGRIPRKNLYTPFTSYSYRYYARTVKELIDEGAVEVTRHKRVNQVAITPKGVSMLQNTYDDSEDVVQAIQEEKASTRNRKQKTRQKLVADVEGLCLANNFLIRAEEKPALIDLFTKTENEELQNKFRHAVDTGVYYSAGEIRATYIELWGKNEIANWTRLVGVVFYKNHITFVYATDRALIQWKPSNEVRSVEFIAKFLRSSSVINSAVVFPEQQSCIVCGEGMTMIPKIIIGRKYGKLDQDEETDRYKAKLARTHINAHNLGKAFCAAYYVPCGHQGIDSFRLATMLTEERREFLCDKWFDSVSTATRIKTLPYHQGLTNNDKREHVSYIPCVDLIELEFLRKQKIRTHIVAPEGTQQAIARVLGPYVLSIRNMSGDKLDYTEYDVYGAPLPPTGEKTP